MTNRMLAILILFSITGVLIAGYLYLYVYYKWSLAITSSHRDYSIVLSNKNLPKDITRTCSNTSCDIHDIPPLHYSLTATSQWFQDYQTTVRIPARDLLNIDIVLHKQYTLETKPSTFAPLDTQEKKSLLQNYSPYKLIENEAGVFIVKRIDNDRISIYQTYQDTFLWSFPFVWNRWDIEIFPVYGSSDMIWISMKDQYYLYHTSYHSLSKIAVQQIDYIKTHNATQLMIIAADGMFYYSPHNQELLKIESLHDFTRYQWEEIFLLQQWSLSEIKKWETLIYSSSERFEKIYSDADNLYLVDTDWNSFTLK